MFGESNSTPNALTIRAPMPKNIKVNTISSSPSKNASLSFFLSFFIRNTSSDKRHSRHGSREQKVYFYAKNGDCKAKRYIFSKEVYSPIVLIGIFCFNKWLQSCLSLSFCSSFIYPAVIIPAGNATIAIPKIAEIMVIIFPATDMV